MVAMGNAGRVLSETVSDHDDQEYGCKLQPVVTSQRLYQEKENQYGFFQWNPFEMRIRIGKVPQDDFTFLGVTDS